MKKIFFATLVMLVASCWHPVDINTPTKLEASYRPPTIRLKYRGTNLSGGEFGAMPGKYGYDYGYPKTTDVDYFSASGMNFFRLGFRHARLQPTLKQPLDETEWTRMLEIVTYATSKGVTVCIEPHDSWRHNGRILAEDEAGWFWGLVGQRFKDNPRVWINLTNEPHDMPTEKAVSLSNASLKELRRVGFKNTVLVPGNAWTGAAHWSSSWYGMANATAMLNVIDPGNNMAFEVHQYLDQDASGGGTECVSTTIGVERLQGFVAWLRANKKVGFLGELGAPNTPTCKEAIRRQLAYVEEQYDVWLGYAWWSGGYRWPASYQLSIEPVNGVERPQMAWLREFLPCAPVTPPKMMLTVDAGTE